MFTPNECKELFLEYYRINGFCRKKKDIENVLYCIMPGHVHFICRMGNGNTSGLMLDFKGFTSKKMLQTIKEN